MKRMLVAGNWKMHLNVQQASLLVHHLDKLVPTHRDVEVVLAPTMLTLQPVSQEIDRRKFRLAAQDAYPVDEGAFTGEVSFAQLQDLVHYCIVGHSSRRMYNNESLELIRDKVQAAVRNGIAPILCIGETKQDRLNGETTRVLSDQLTSALSNLTSDDLPNVVIAYEPVWAISANGGEPAKPEDMQKAFEFIKKQIADLYGEAAAARVRILYGGSVDGTSATAFLSLPDCDGVLVGAASLNYHEFAKIAEKAHAVNLEQKRG